MKASLIAFLMPASLLLATPAIAGLKDAHIEELEFDSRGFHPVKTKYEIYCGENVRSHICDVEFLDEAIRVDEDYLPYSKIINFWRNHWEGKFTDHIYIRYIDQDGIIRIAQFISVSVGDRAEIWNLLQTRVHSLN